MGIRALHRLVLTAVLAGVLTCGPASAQSPQAIEQAVKESVRALDLQTDLKLGREQFQLNLRLPPELVWGALICAALLLAYAIYRDALPFWRRRGEEWDGSGSDADASAPAGAQDALTTADALSREGRFVEAIHLLLLQGLADIRQRLGMQFEDSLTSREILRRARLSSQGRTSLQEMVAAVEWTYFGGYPAELADYTACRRSFANLRQALSGATA
jgi:Domain of unknown function (DUF4129)